MAAIYRRDDKPDEDASPSVDLPLVSVTPLLVSRTSSDRGSGPPKLVLIIASAFLLVSTTAIVTATIVMTRDDSPAAPAVSPAAAVPSPAPAAALATAPKKPTRTMPRDQESIAVALPESRESGHAESSSAASSETSRSAARSARAVSSAPESAPSAPVAVTPPPPAPPAASSAPASTATGSPAPATVEAKTEAATRSTKCDEVTCLVDPKAACCAKKQPDKSAAAGAEGEAEAPPADPNLPEALTRADVDSGLRPVRGRIESCADNHGFSGTATIKLRVKPDGSVASAAVSEGTPEFQSCVSDKVRQVSFSATQKGTSIRYPLVFR